MSGSTLPTNQAVRYNQALRLFELGAIKNSTPVIRESGLPNVEEIIQGEDFIRQAMGTINNLQEMIKQLEGDNQTLQSEARHANEKALIAKTKAELDALVSKANASVLLGQQRTNDAVKSFERRMDDIIQTKKSEVANSKEKTTTQENKNV